MISLRRHNRASALRRVAFALVFTAIAGGILILKPGLMAQPLLAVSEPLFQGGNRASVGASNVLEFFRFKSSLVAENRELREKMAEAQIQLLALESLRQENESLKHMFGRGEKQNPLLAAVLRKPPLFPYDSLLLDVGEDRGVKKGDKVVAKLTVVIGEVEEVYGTTAKVLLYSAPGMATSALVGSASVPVEALGKGGGNFEARLPRDVPIAVGDSVVLPGLDKHLLGVIATIDARSSDAFQTLSWNTPQNVFELDRVEVLRSP